MKNVLIVVDMQNDFINMALGTDEALTTVDPVVSLIKDEQFDTVIATMDTHGEDYMDTYEGKHLSELFREMKKKRESIMAVLDEYGDLSGIVTIEDILEELVGDIRDEYDEDEELEIVQISDHQYEVQGYLSLDDINEKIGTDFESEDYDSIGGLLIEHLERLPEIGDSVQVGNCTLTAKDVDKNVIKLVDITLHESGLN